MNATYVALLEPILLIFTPIIIGVSVGVEVRQLVNCQSTRIVIARLFDTIALKVFLPFFIIESIIRNQLSLNIGIAFIVGLLLPVVAFFIASLCRNLSLGINTTAQNPAFPFLVGTFGGGNRGTAVFILLFSYDPDFNEYLQWFSVVDLGNFIC